jgi:hypothetical protein
MTVMARLARRVMPGLDPGIHHHASQSRLRLWSSISLMDCRVKPGNDDWIWRSVHPWLMNLVFM